MHILTTHFTELLKNIEPPQYRLEAAKELPDKVRDYLKNTDGFPTSSPYSALSGSYRRHTAIGDIKDVDIIVKVDVGLDENPGSIIRKLKDKLDDLPKELGLQGYTEIKQSRRSVHVYFEEKDFHLDVVPAIIPKSYWLEALVVYHIKNGSLNMDQSLPEIFHDLMSAIYNKFAPMLGREDGATPNIPDPMLENDISWNWDRSHFETFMNRVKEAENTTQKALQTEDQEEAITLWQNVFGEEHFPKDTKQAAHKLAEAAPGKASVSSAGIISSLQPAFGKYLASKPTRFYGEE